MSAYQGVVVFNGEESFNAIDRFASSGGLFSLKIHAGEANVFVLTPVKANKED